MVLWMIVAFLSTGSRGADEKKYWRLVARASVGYMPFASVVVGAMWLANTLHGDDLLAIIFFATRCGIDGLGQWLTIALGGVLGCLIWIIMPLRYLVGKYWKFVYGNEVYLGLWPFVGGGTVLGALFLVASHYALDSYNCALWYER